MALEQLRQFDALFEKAKMLVETACSLIVDSTCIQHERVIALFTCPLLARVNKGLPGSLPFGLFAHDKFAKVGYSFTGKVAVVSYAGKAQSFPLLILSNEKHGLFSMVCEVRG